MSSTGKEFIEQTKYKNLAVFDHKKGIKQPPLELDYNKKNKILDLPSPNGIKIPNIDLREVIEKRRSLRDYSDKPLTLEELSYLLWVTQGVKKVIPNTTTFRNVPSAGARHAFETYLLINNVGSLKPGLYRYLAIEHKLLEINVQPEIAERIMQGCLGQEFTMTSSVTFIWTAVAKRMTWRYSDRGYRYLFLDAGHVCQNLYLAAESIGCGACAIAAYDDDQVNFALRIDGEEQFVIYIATVGKKGA